MKSIVLVAFLVSLADFSPFDGKTPLGIKQDTLSARQRHRLKFALDSNQRKGRWYTLYVRPMKGRTGNEIGMPIGFNRQTVQVHLDDRLLQRDTDYVFVSNGSRIKLLDPVAFVSPNPLRITYELLRLGYSP